MKRTLPILAVAITSVAGCTTTAILSETTPVSLSAAPPAAEVESAVAVEDTRLRVDEKIHFEFGSANISGESDGILSEIARVIQDNPELGRVRVEGHTDRSGSARYNRRLSQRRAAAVVSRLTDAGVPAERLESEGFGFSQPVADNGTDEGRAENRRVEFVLADRTAN